MPEVHPYSPKPPLQRQIWKFACQTQRRNIS
ncbi:hypothetical protein F383_18758 [Gossypium arboreum]|uniref:Uncharacterized protein n=1 Tax=Gossypium arboreum TaxID=29729 RepID=A0A0B0NIT2_GOSAR|nr:hypothetical protein F383_18758 [Gossypium arboreum]